MAEQPRRKRFIYTMHRVSNHAVNAILDAMQDTPGLTVDHVYARQDPDYLSVNVVIHYRASEVWKG